MELQWQPSSRTTAPSRAEHPWLASRLLNRQIVSVARLDQVGRVADVIFDSSRSLLVGVTAQMSEPSQRFAARVGRMFGLNRTTGDIALEHIVALNGDVVMVDADPARSSSSHYLARMSHLNEVCELAILTTYGMCLGSLADVLLDERGADILGYVVKPTEVGESLLPTLENVQLPIIDSDESAEPHEVAPGSASADAPPSTRLRVLPASSRVHFGDSLVLYVAEVEPLIPQTVVVSPQTEGVRA